MPPGTLIIRADASIAMGTGHVMRCLALAQAWQDAGGECIFAMTEATPSVEERVRSEKIETVAITARAGSPQDAAQLSELAGNARARWVVVDGYQFDVEYQGRVKAAGLKLMLIDDTGHADAYVADVVLDQNAHASEDSYQHREAYTQLLLGSRYSMLRRDFRAWRDWKREISSLGRKVLVTMGGSDPENQTLRAIRALQRLQIEGFEARIVVGGSNPHFDSLELAAAGASQNLKLVRNTKNMPELMAWADIAVAAGGSVAWELAFMGLPTVFTVSTEHQRPIAEAAAMEGAGICFGALTAADEPSAAAAIEDLLRNASQRRTMAENGRRLVDGAGAERVVSILCAGEEIPVEKTGTV
jgi:UDP-2,4-diacetamido-2,4,6-trideoxy-beta-L-altropyranose hydrolase